MSKKTKKKGGKPSSDRLVMKAKQSKEMKAKVNPFERNFTKEKHKVFNRKKKGTEIGSGKPGQARVKAMEKREKTLLVEYLAKNKANVVRDRRIGVRSGDQEEAMVERFAKERSRETKGSKFGLGDEDMDGDDLLTHGGKALRDIERFEDTREKDEEDDDDKKLNADFVDRAHFGGFLSQSDVEFASGKSNTRKEWIEQMIAESKKRKMEKATALEEAETQTTELDKKWKEMHSNPRSAMLALMKKNKKLEDDDGENAFGAGRDPYDALFAQLGLQGSGAAKKVAMERLKTDDEIVAEEKERLEKLEANRVSRMRGDVAETSPDVGDKDDDNDEKEDVSDSEQDGDGSSSDDAEEGGEDDEDEDDNSDLESSDEDDDEDESKEEEGVKLSKVEKSKVTKGGSKGDSKGGSKGDPKGDPKGDLSPIDKSKEMEEAKMELPYTFAVPEDYNGLAGLFGLFAGRTPVEQGTIIERMIKCNHPKLGMEGSKEKLEILLQFLLQYVHDQAEQFDPELKEEEEDELGSNNVEMEAIEQLTPHIYTLAQFSQASAAKSVLSVIREKYEEFQRRPKSGVRPELLVFLKLSVLLFPPSDYRHPVTTPAFQIMSHVLSASRFSTRNSIASGLFVATLFVESIEQSRRFSPELLNFVSGILYSSYPAERSAAGATSLSSQVVPPFRPVGPDAKVLHESLLKRRKTGEKKEQERKSKLSEERGEPPQLCLSDCRTSAPLDADFAAAGLRCALDLADAALGLWAEMPSAAHLARNAVGRHLTPLRSAVAEHWPELLENVSRVEERMAELTGRKTTWSRIQSERKRPKILRLYEPEIEDNFDPFSKASMSKKGNKVQNEFKKLQHKSKREMKGARKEIRQDTAFVARLRAKESREADDIRKRKTKELLSGLGNQEGDWRKMQRKRKHMK